MAVTINAGQPTKLIITIPSKGDTNWNKVMRQAFQDIGDHDHSGVNGRGAKIQAAGLADGAIEPRHLSNDIDLSALADVQIVYDPNDPSNPSLDGKLLVWDSTASKWVPTDPSSAEIGGGSGGGSSTLDDTNTVGTFNNGDNIGTTVQLTDQDAFVTTGGVADFTAYVGGNPPISPSLTDVTIYADVPVKMEDATNVTIFTDSPVELTGDATDVQIVSDSTVTISGNVSGGNISSGTLDVTGTVSDANIEVSGSATIDGAINGSSIKTTANLTTEGNITDSDIRTEGNLNTTNNNVTDSRIFTKGDADLGTGELIRSNLTCSSGDLILTKIYDSTVRCYNLKLDYSKYDPTTSTPYTSQAVPIPDEIYKSDLFIDNNIQVINDSLNWNDDNIRGKWINSRIYAKTGDLYMHGNSSIQNCDINCAIWRTRTSGGASSTGFTGNTSLTCSDYHQSHNNYKLESDVHLNIKEWKSSTIGFNSKTLTGAQVSGQPVYIKNKIITNSMSAAIWVSDVHSPDFEIKNFNDDWVYTRDIHPESTSSFPTGYSQPYQAFSSFNFNFLQDNSWFPTEFSRELATHTNSVNIPAEYSTSQGKFVIREEGLYRLSLGNMGLSLNSQDNDGNGMHNGVAIRLIVDIPGESNYGNLKIDGTGGGTYGNSDLPGDSRTATVGSGYSSRRMYLPEGTTLEFDAWAWQGGAQVTAKERKLNYIQLEKISNSHRDGWTHF